MPYQETDARLDLADLSAGVDEVLTGFLKEYDNEDIVSRTEPGRYIAAKCGILLGTVHAVKINCETKIYRHGFGL